MTLKPLTLIIAAGGTGGHMFPADSLAQELKRRGHRPVLLSDSRGLKFPGLFGGVESHLIASGTFAGGGIGGKIGTFFSLWKGFFKAMWLMIKINPEGVIGFGGYPVVPTMSAARFLRIPYGLHEQNAVLGRANRAIAGKARMIAISFPETRKVRKHYLTKTYVTGNPVREAIIGLGEKPYPAPAENKVFRLLVFGGSQGASVFGRVVPEALGMLPKAVRDRLRVTQQSREDEKDKLEAAYKKHGVKVRALTFIKDIPAKLARTHLVIGRAGASTVFELAAAGRPAVLVPFPSAMDDHQTANASLLADAGAAWVFAEKDFTARALAKHLQQVLVRDNALGKAAAAARALARPDAAKRLADLVEDMASREYATLREKALEQKERQMAGNEFRRAAA